MKTHHFLALQQILATAPLQREGSNEHEDYMSSFLRMSNFTNAVNKSYVPEEMKSCVRYWDDYNACLKYTRQMSSNWVDDVISSLINYPSMFLKQSQKLDQRFKKMIKECDNQIRRADPIGQQRLAEDINFISEELKESLKEIEKLLTQIGQYNLSLSNQLVCLHRIANMSAQDDRADREQVEEMKQFLKEANKELDILSKDLLKKQKEHVYACVIVSLGLISMPVGAIPLIIGSISLVCNSEQESLDKMKLSLLRTCIDQCVDKMNNYTAAIATMQCVNEQFSQLITDSKDIKGSLKLIYDVWFSLEKDLIPIALEIRESERNMTTADWIELKKDVVQAKRLLEKFISDINITKLDQITGNDCQLTLGMTRKQVEKAMREGHQMPILEFVKRTK